MINGLPFSDVIWLSATVGGSLIAGSTDGSGWVAPLALSAVSDAAISISAPFGCTSDVINKEFESFYWLLTTYSKYD